MKARSVLGKMSFILGSSEEPLTPDFNEIRRNKAQEMLTSKAVGDCDTRLGNRNEEVRKTRIGGVK